ncbi:hypothetical protein [Sorlinia euscelidii]|uniref:hypothetical protein n=1 Tax=Sorlinia euscelidii TaxID=3081148 RepID=UPI003AACDD51
MKLSTPAPRLCISAVRVRRVAPVLLNNVSPATCAVTLTPGPVPPGWQAIAAGI